MTAVRTDISTTVREKSSAGPKRIKARPAVGTGRVWARADGLVEKSVMRQKLSLWF